MDHILEDIMESSIVVSEFFWGDLGLNNVIWFTLLKLVSQGPMCGREHLLPNYT